MPPRKQVKSTAEISHTAIANAVRTIRGQRVILDEDLAELYGVETRILVQAVKRNLERFPEDFMFRITQQELGVLRSQFVTSSSIHGGRRTLPYAFTEQGVAMLSSVLNSPQAIAVNISIMRTFVRMRGILTSSKELAEKLDELERRINTHDRAIAGILEAIRSLMTPPAQSKKPIGFVHPEGRKR
jgi:hypothetical protein